MLPRAWAPTHRGASLALPRVPMATARAPAAAHLARREGLGAARRITAAAACRAPAPRAAPRRSPSPASPSEAHPQAQTLCERAPSPLPGARARPLAPTT